MVHTQREKIDPLAILWQEARQAHFLHTVPGHETLAALQKRGELVEQLLAQLDRGTVHSQRADPASLLMLDHCSTSLNAELAWLEHTIQRLHTRLYAL